jgi:1-acyl-sn-glycerol-3-phosphate acyltransferase
MSEGRDLSDWLIDRALPLAKHALAKAGELAQRSRDRSSDAVIALLGEDFEARVDHVRANVGERGIDPFGLDPEWAKWAVACSAVLHRIWFRTEVHGVDRVPAGRVLLVANHSGQIPLDGMVIGATMFLDHDPPRVVRSMVERWSQTLPYVALAFQRVGQVVGVPANAKRLLELGECVLVFPEGVRGISKTYAHRYELQPFGLGFMRLALETKTPIVPVAVIGAEEQYVSVANLERVARLFGLPSLPLLPQLLIPGGQLPLPVRYRLYFGDPMRFEGDHDDDDAVVAQKVDAVRAAIDGLLQRGLAERESLFF